MNSAAASDFELDPAVDAARAQKAFAEAGRVQIWPFLKPECAAGLLRHLRRREDWRLILNAGDNVYEIDRPGQAGLSLAQRETLEAKLFAAARSGFQYRFESIRVPDEPAEREARNSLLDRFALFMSSDTVLDLFRSVTGEADIGFADAQATCYHSGHFLTAHDDDVEGKGRRAAYVLGLTDPWRADWGGLLMFHDSRDDIEHAYMPRMNALNLFAVPQRHSVSLVAPFAGASRYSVTGWLRAGPAA